MSSAIINRICIYLMCKDYVTECWFCWERGHWTEMCSDVVNGVICLRRVFYYVECCFHCGANENRESG